MKFLYLYVENFRSLKNVEFNLDSNERFHYDGEALHYEHADVLKEGFFSVGGSIKSVESVSAIVGENGSGKTSFATMLNYIFVLERPYPRYICVCKIDRKYIAFENLENTPDDRQVKSVLGEKWDFRSRTMHRDTEGCPFDVLYYSSFLHSRFVWDDRNRWCHDISATGSLNASIRMVMTTYFQNVLDKDARQDVPDSPIECMDKNLNIARIEFLHKFAAIPEEKRKGIPFPLSLTMEIKPNVKLFADFEAYLHQLLEESKTDLEMRENVNDIVRLKNYYKTDDWFKTLLVAFTICLAQELGYEKLGHENCPEILDLIDMCQSEWSFDDVIRVLNGSAGRNVHSSRVDPKSWIYVDGGLLREFIELWAFLFDKRETDTMGGGFRVSLQHADSKKKLLRLLHLQAMLLSGKRGSEPFNTLRAKNFISCDPAGMSSGECSYLNLFALLYQRMHTELSQVNGPLLVAIDEAETTLHPEWQRQMVYNVIWFFENFVNGCSVHIVFMTHSPMLLSDIPIGNCVFLRNEDGVSRIEDIDLGKSPDSFANTFGANIFDMYYHPFFMKNGTIGKFAMQKIEKALASKDTEGAEIVKLTGDPFLRGLLLDEFGVCNPADDVVADEEFVYVPNVEYPRE